MEEPTGTELAAEQIKLKTEEFEKSCLRELRKRECECSADCCDNSSATIQEVRDCIEQCKRPRKIVADYHARELNAGTKIFEFYTIMCKNKIAQLEWDFSQRTRGQFSDYDVEIITNAEEICHSPMFESFDALAENAEKTVRECIEQGNFESLAKPKTESFIKVLVDKLIYLTNRTS